jgi:hypothetical protein
MFLSRRGSLHALEQTRPSAFWARWLGQEMPSADSIGRICSRMDVSDVRASVHQAYSRLKRMKALEPPVHGLMQAVVDGHETTAKPTALLVFFLFAMLCLNVFMAFYRRNLKPAARKAVSMLHIAQLIASELYSAIRQGPARAPI